jgi:hypothetical protein
MRIMVTADERHPVRFAQDCLTISGNVLMRSRSEIDAGGKKRFVGQQSADQAPPQSSA